MKTWMTALALCTTLTVAGQQTLQQQKFIREWAFKVILSPDALPDSNIGLPGNPSNLIAYKAIYKNGNTFRFGFGGFYNTSERGTTLFTVNLNSGYEKQRRISPHWITFVGIDIPFSYSKADCLNDSLDANPCKFLEVGAGGIWGIQWMINEQVGIRTEGGLYYNHLRSKGDDELSNHSVKFVLPQSLYFGVRF